MGRFLRAFAAVALSVAPMQGAVLSGPVDRTIVQGESHVHELDLPAGRFVALRLTEYDVDLDAAVVDGSGAEVVKAAAPAFRTRMEWMTGAAGRYRLTIKPQAESSEVGWYHLEVLENRPAVARDAQRIAAQAAFDEGAALLVVQSAASVKAATEPLGRALALFRELRDCEGEADALYALANIQAVAEDPAVLQTFDQALALQRAIGNRKAEAETLFQIGSRWRVAGDVAKARELYEQSLAAYRSVGSAAGEAQARNGLGLLEGAAGNHRAAIPHYEQALEVTHSIGNKFQEALFLNNIAVSATSLGEWRGALAKFDRAAAIYQQIGERRELANTLSNIGGAFAWLGEYREALVRYRHAQPILEEVGDQRLATSTQIYIGVTHLQLGELAEARQALAEGMRRALALEDLRYEAMAERHLGRLAEKEGSREASLEHHRRSLLLWQVTGNRRGQTFALLSIASQQFALGNEAAARAALAEATAMACELEDPGLEASARMSLARIERKADPLRAWREIESALSLIESVRGNVAGHHLRTAYLTTVRDHYELAVSVLVELHRREPSAGWDVLALQTSEKARARGLLDMLSEAQVDIRGGVDPALLAREQRLRDALNDKAARLARQPSAKLAAEVDALVAGLRKAEIEIYSASPRYADLARPKTTTLREIREGVLDDETMLLEFAIGEERSFVWAVTAATVDVYELPKRSEIESVARRVYDALTARNRRPSSETPAARAERLMHAKADFNRAAAELSAMLLLDRSHPKKRLLIVAEGALQYVPFAALPGIEGRPLVADYEIVSMPSVSALTALRQEVRDRAPAAGAVAVVADPVFSRNDPRVGGVRLVSRQRDALARLPLTRGEAESIVRLAGAEETLAALDFDASLDAVTGGALAGYRYVHFATHGVVDSTHPELSGIVLSLVDEKGEPRDGFLRLHDIYTLRLPADLVVLSACETALGKEVRAEGLLGLTRGFMYAGAARVVSSLWKIDDRATAELMKRFYARMLGAERQAPSAALRAAQVEMSRSERWRDPYYWAAFTLQGDWR